MNGIMRMKTEGKYDKNGFIQELKIIFYLEGGGSVITINHYKDMKVSETNVIAEFKLHSECQIDDIMEYNKYFVDVMKG